MTASERARREDVDEERLHTIAALLEGCRKRHTAEISRFATRACQEKSMTDTAHTDLCTLLQLDPERATPDDVLALVGGLLDAAGRLDRLRAALADVADASPGTLSQTAAAMRALREYGERAAPPSPWRPLSEADASAKRRRIMGQRPPTY